MGACCAFGFWKCTPGPRVIVQDVRANFALFARGNTSGPRVMLANGRTLRFWEGRIHARPSFVGSISSLFRAFSGETGHCRFQVLVKHWQQRARGLRHKYVRLSSHCLAPVTGLQSKVCTDKLWVSESSKRIYVRVYECAQAAEPYSICICNGEGVTVLQGAPLACLGTGKI